MSEQHPSVTLRGIANALGWRLCAEDAAFMHRLADELEGASIIHINDATIERAGRAYADLSKPLDWRGRMEAALRAAVESGDDPPYDPRPVPFAEGSAASAAGRLATEPPTELPCPKCGRMLPAHANYCPDCAHESPTCTCSHGWISVRDHAAWCPAATESECSCSEDERAMYGHAFGCRFSTESEQP